MPIHLDSHTPELDIDPNTTKGHIIAFLYQHAEFGYKPAEIQEELDIPHGTATTTLARLLESGYIGKTPDSYYHAREDREDLKRYASSYEQLTRLTARYEDSPPVDPTQAQSRDAELEAGGETEPAAETIEAELDALENEVGSDAGR